MNRMKKIIVGFGLVGLLGSYNIDRVFAEEVEAKTRNDEVKKEVSLEERCKDRIGEKNIIWLKGEAGEHYNKGIKAQMAKRYDEAIAEYQKAAELDGNNGLPFYQIACSYREQGDFEKAIEWYKKATEIDPCFAAGYRGAGLLYFKLGEYELSLRYNTEYLKFNPKEPEFVLKEIEEAKKKLNK